MLKEKLENLKSSSKERIPKEAQEKMEKALTELREKHIKDHVIKVDSNLPDFKLIDTDGKVHTRNDFKGEKLILNFFRGSW